MMPAFIILSTDGRATAHSEGGAVLDLPQGVILAWAREGVQVVGAQVEPPVKEEPSELPRYFIRALAQVTRAMKTGEWAKLGTVNEHLQPLVDAAMKRIVGKGWSQVGAGWPPPPSPSEPRAPDGGRPWVSGPLGAHYQPPLPPRHLSPDVLEGLPSAERIAYLEGATRLVQLYPPNRCGGTGVVVDPLAHEGFGGPCPGCPGCWEKEPKPGECTCPPETHELAAEGPWQAVVDRFGDEALFLRKGEAEPFHLHSCPAVATEEAERLARLEG
jgi:hypothetical protein